MRPAFLVVLTLLMSAAAPSVAADVPSAESADIGAVSARALHRMLLTNAVRAGTRLIAVGEQGYIVYSDDGAQNWRRAQTPASRNSLLTAIAVI